MGENGWQCMYPCLFPVWRTLVTPLPNTGLSKHGDPVFPHFCPWNQKLARVRTSGGRVWLLLYCCISTLPRGPDIAGVAQ